MVPHHEPGDGATRPDDVRARTEALYLAHWEYVLRILPSYGIPLNALPDLSQSIWLTVQERLATYDPEVHKTPRAWLTGIARRCAANYRRTFKRRPEVLTDEAGSLAVAPSLDPERAALLRTLRQAIRDPERYEAFVLRVQHGLSIEEIATATGATESAVEWRLRMAKKDLEEQDDDAKKRGAFLGFGSFEALVEALRPKPLPPELGAEQWKQISERIQDGARPEFDDTESPPSSAPAPSAAPASTSNTTIPSVLAKGAVGGLVVLAFFAGALSGGLLARHADDGATSVPAEDQRAAPTKPAAEAHAAAPPLFETSASAMPPDAARASTKSPRGTTQGSSLRLILQMRHAAESGNAAAVLALADEHARNFPNMDVAEREAERRKATAQLKRRDAASQPAP